MGSSVLTRAYTHGDVSAVGRRKMTNFSQSKSSNKIGISSEKSVSDLSYSRFQQRSSSSYAFTPTSHHGRSQSLLEIGNVSPNQDSSTQTQTLPKRNPNPTAKMRRNTVSKIKDFCIPEQESPSLDLAMAKKIDLDEVTSSLPAPPWKLPQTQSGSGKYSPAFKRKPFVIYTSSSTKQDETETEDKPGTQTRITPPSKTDPRILKKNSIEALNRKNILESCKKSSGTFVSEASSTFQAVESQQAFSVSRQQPIVSLGKPASRSSSFTIAERKKSLESMTSRLMHSGSELRRGGHQHSSQDSLTMSRKTSLERLENSLNSSSNSRRSSKDTIGEEVETNPPPMVIESRRSSRSEADGGSRVATPTGGGSATQSPVDRSFSATPTEKKVISAPKPFDRSTSVVSKDSGLPEEGHQVDNSNSTISDTSVNSKTEVSPKISEEKWSLLEKKYSISSKATNFDDTKSKIARFSVSTESVSEHKYSRPELNVRRSSLTTPTSSNISAFRAITEKFEPFSSSTQKDKESETKDKLQSPFPNTSFRVGEKTNYSWMDDEGSISKASFYIPEENTEWESFDPSAPPNSFYPPIMTSSPSPGSKIEHRKYSTPINPMVENFKVNKDDMMESSSIKDDKSFDSSLSTPTSTSRTNSHGDLLDATNSSEKLISSSVDPNISSPCSSVGVVSNSSRELLETFSSSASTSKVISSSIANVTAGDPNRRCVSVNDIRRAFEKAEQSLTTSLSNKTGSSSSSSGGLSIAPCHNRMSSLDSTTSEESSIPTPHYYGSVSSLLSGHSNVKDHYGSITSLASSTSLISPQVFLYIMMQYECPLGRKCN